MVQKRRPKTPRGNNSGLFFFWEKRVFGHLDVANTQEILIVIFSFLLSKYVYKKNVTAHFLYFVEMSGKEALF